VPVRDGKDERREERMYLSVREGEKAIAGSPSEYNYNIVQEQ
jgi:hypothetical protein